MIEEHWQRRLPQIDTHQSCGERLILGRGHGPSCSFAYAYCFYCDEFVEWEASPTERTEELQKCVRHNIRWPWVGE